MSKPITIRKLGHWKQMDQGIFRDLDNACFPADSSFDNTEDYHWWVLCVGTQPVAYAGMKVAAWNGDASKVVRVQFTRCGVLPEYRGQGFQMRLIKRRLTWCRRAGVRRVETYTTLDNPQSRKHLLAAGFKSRKQGEFFRYRMDL